MATGWQILLDSLYKRRHADRNMVGPNDALIGRGVVWGVVMTFFVKDLFVTKLHFS